MKHNCHKKKYSTRHEAERALHGISSNHRHGQHPLRVYECGCGAWHLTSQHEFRNEMSDMDSIIHNLHDQIHKLKDEIQLLKTQTITDLHLALEKDSYVATLKKQITSRDKTIVQLKKDIVGLIHRLMMAQNRNAA